MSLPKLKLFIRNSYFSFISVVETHFSSKKKKKKKKRIKKKIATTAADLNYEVSKCESRCIQ